MITARIVQFVGAHEGFVSKAYLDPAGILTIGYGFTMRSKVSRSWWMAKYGRNLQRGDTISKADAHDLLLMVLRQEMLPFVVDRFGAIALNITEAATSFVYNAGPGALKWKWAVAIVAGRLAEGARRWRKTATTAGGKRLAGLVRRRAEEAKIAEFNRWPDYVTEAPSAPEYRLTDETIRQAQIWLKKLGYEVGEVDGVAGGRTIAATKRFQIDHGTLKADGIIGPATLAALRRAMDLRAKAGGTVAAGGVTTGAGAADNATGASDALPVDAGWLSDALVWGGALIITAGLAWLAWRYRDELKTVLRKL
jgi:lysozyme